MLPAVSLGLHKQNCEKQRTKCVSFIVRASMFKPVNSFLEKKRTTRTNQTSSTSTSDLESESLSLSLSDPTAASSTNWDRVVHAFLHKCRGLVDFRRFWNFPVRFQQPSLFREVLHDYVSLTREKRTNHPINQSIER